MCIQNILCCGWYWGVRAWVQFSLKKIYETVFLLLSFVFVCVCVGGVVRHFYLYLIVAFVMCFALLPF